MSKRRSKRNRRRHPPPATDRPAGEPDAGDDRGTEPLPPRRYDATLADAAGESGRRGGPVRGSAAYGYDPTIADAAPASPDGALGVAGGVGAFAGGGAFEVVRELGGGGMGKVYLARDVRLKRWVALKRLSQRFLSDPKLRRRFQTEAEAVARLDHHHIVKVYVRDEDADGPFIAMEYVPGPKVQREGAYRDWPDDFPAPPLSLQERVDRSGVLDVAAAAELGAKLCRALAHAHGHDVIHRDVKPANILLNEQLDPKLTDFGLARRLDTTGEQVTLAGSQLLTIGYGAPEQEADASKVDARADVYGLGATLWFALTGQSPRFFRESEVPSALRRVLTKALAKDRERRYGSAKAFGRALEECLTASASPPVLEPVRRTGAPAGYWQCDACGKINPADARHCEECGADSMVECPECRRMTRRGTPHCGHCGVHVGKFLQYRDVIGRAAAAERAKHYHAAAALLEPLLADGQATPGHRNQARQRNRAIESSFRRRRDHLRGLEEAISRGQWQPGGDALIRLRGEVPAEVTDPAWQMHEEDEEFARQFAEQERLFRERIQRAAAAAEEARDLAAWAEASRAARRVFPDEPWQDSPQYAGQELRDRFTKQLREVRDRLRGGKMASLEDYRQAKGHLDEALPWTGRADAKLLRKTAGEIDEAIEELDRLLPAWEGSRYRQEQLARLGELLPGNARVRAAVEHEAEALRSRAQRAERASRWLDAEHLWNQLEALTGGDAEARQCARRRLSWRLAIYGSLRRRWPRRGYSCGIWLSLLLFFTVLPPLVEGAGTFRAGLWTAVGLLVGVVHGRMMKDAVGDRGKFLPLLYAVAFLGGCCLGGGTRPLVELGHPIVVARMLAIAGGLASICLVAMHVNRWRQLQWFWPVPLAMTLVPPVAWLILVRLQEGLYSTAVAVVGSTAWQGLSDSEARTAASVVHGGSLVVASLVAAWIAGKATTFPLYAYVSSLHSHGRPWLRQMPLPGVIAACWVLLAIALGGPLALALGAGLLGLVLAVATAKVLRPTGLGKMKLRLSIRRLSGRGGYLIRRIFLYVLVLSGLAVGAGFAARAIGLDPTASEPGSVWLRLLGRVPLGLTMLGAAAFLILGGRRRSRLIAMLSLPLGWLAAGMLHVALPAGGSWPRWLTLLGGAVVAACCLVAFRARRQTTAGRVPSLIFAALVLGAGWGWAFSRDHVPVPGVRRPAVAPVPGPTPAKVSRPPVRHPRVSRSGTTFVVYPGRLEDGDSRMSGGRYCDLHYFRAERGSLIHLELDSSDFDPLLTVWSPARDEYKDDDGGPGRNSRLLIRANRSGRWCACVSTYRTGTGSYELRVRMERPKE